MPDPQVPEPRRTVQVLSVLVIVPMVTFGWVSMSPPDRVSVALLMAVALAAAVMFGLPAWMWAAEHAHCSLSVRLALAGAAGLGPSVTLLMAAAAGLLWRDGWADTVRLFGEGAPIPGLGVVPWPAFGSFSAQCGGVGALSGAIQWAIVRLAARRDASPG